MSKISIRWVQLIAILGALLLMNSTIDKKQDNVSMQNKQQLQEVNKNQNNDTTNYSEELGEVIATIEIPRLNIKEEVYYGHDYLDYHNLILDENYNQTGEGKKVVIAGHKENISEYLKQKEGGDQIILTTSMGTYNYEVKNIEVVNQNDTEILEENINEE